MNDISARAEVVLQQLIDRPIDDWLTIGRVLMELTRISPASKCGTSWQNIVSEKLQEAGTTMTPGHLHKIRRVYDFLERAKSDLNLSEERIAAVKLSAVEVAERLFRLDWTAGYEALEACIRPSKPAKLSEIKTLYDTYLAAHPEKMNPRQLGWKARKVSAVPSDDPDASGFDEAPHSHTLEQIDIKLFAELRDVISKLTHLEQALEARDTRIRILEAELDEMQMALDEALQDYGNLSLSVRD